MGLQRYALLVFITGCNFILLLYNGLYMLPSSFQNYNSSSSSIISQQPYSSSSLDNNGVHCGTSSSPSSLSLASSSFDDDVKSITNNHSSSWCPFAQERCIASSSPLCPNPCQRRYLLILASGRSGSTSMRQMLNLLPGVRIGGENNNAFENIYNFLFDNSTLPNSTNLLSFQLQLEPSKKGFNGPWGHYPIHRNDLVCLFQSILGSINPPPPPYSSPDSEENKDKGDDDTLSNSRYSVDNPRTTTMIIEGFKEIRILKKIVDDVRNDTTVVQDFINQMNHVVPCSRIIVNYNSNIQTQINSQMTLGWVQPKYRQDATEALMVHNKRLLELAKRLGPEQVNVFDSSVYKTNQTHALEQINKIIKWLGFQNCVFKNLLHANAKGSYQPQQETTFDLGPNCHYYGEE